MTVIKINEEMCIGACICCTEQVSSTCVRQPSKVQSHQLKESDKRLPFVAVLAAVQAAGRSAGGVSVQGPVLVWNPRTGKKSRKSSGSTAPKLYMTPLFWKMFSQDGAIKVKGGGGKAQKEVCRKSQLQD